MFVGWTAVHWHLLRELGSAEHCRSSSLALGIVAFSCWDFDRCLRQSATILMRREALKLSGGHLNVLFWIVVLARVCHVCGKRIDSS